MRTRLPLSAAIITLNEEADLPRCLVGIEGLVSEIVIVDSGSTDGTRAIAEKVGARFEVAPWRGYVAQKNLALRRASEPWVLCLDADEAVSPELARSIREAFAGGDPVVNGFFVNRRTWYLGDWIRHAWYPEWRLRLARAKCAEWTGLDPPDLLVVPGATARLKGDLLHYSYADLRDHLERTIHYARLSADAHTRAGRRSAGLFQLAFLPWPAFVRQLVLKSAWRDGWRGWAIAFATLTKVFAKNAFLLEDRLRGAKKPPAG